MVFGSEFEPTDPTVCLNDTARFKPSATSPEGQPIAEPQGSVGGSVRPRDDGIVDDSNPRTSLTRPSR